MRLIYLDQWAWIQLARAFHRIESSKILCALLEFVQTAKESGTARFPLSLAHYYETNTHRDHDSRLRLFEVMSKFSELDSIASLDSVIRYEVERALKRRFPDHIIEKPFSLIGKGVQHASGYPREINIKRKKGMSSNEHTARKAFAEQWFQISSLVGPDAFGSGLPRITEFPGGRNFSALLSALPNDVKNIPDFGLEAYFTDRCINDIRPIIEKVLLSSGLSWKAFETLKPSDKIQFVNELPSRRVEKHLMRQFAKNANLPKRDSDLNDWVYLGIAVSYCDIVLAEKQFTDLVNRKGLVKKAVVISSLAELPRV